MSNIVAPPSIVRYRSLVVALVLPLLGLVLIVVAQTFHFEWQKIEVDRVVAEIGALLLIVFVLHWFFELGIRQEMLRDVATAVAGSSRIHDLGVEDCCLNSRTVDDSLHWSRSAKLIIGRQYSTRFLKDFHEVISDRCVSNLPTAILMVAADSEASQYLERDAPGVVGQSIEESVRLFSEADPGEKKNIKLFLHKTIQRYSFIMTDEYAWITFYTNGQGRALVPALKIRAASPLYKFFSKDIKNLLEHSNEVKWSS